MAAQQITFPTAFEFRLPVGFADEESGQPMRGGVMRLSTAQDEIIAYGDYRSADNKAYAIIILLSRVIVRLGELTRVYPDMIENFDGADLAYLQDFYEKINDRVLPAHPVTCPTCGHAMHVHPSSGAFTEVLKPTEMPHPLRKR